MERKLLPCAGFIRNKTLHFESKGKVQGKVHSGSWTLSRMDVEKIDVSADKVELSGSRLAEVNTSKVAKFVLVPTTQQIHIVVDRDSAEPEAVVLQSIDQIFLNENDRVIDLVPDYWKEYLAQGKKKSSLRMTEAIVAG